MTGPYFVEAGPASSKVACSACGRTGYRGGSWQETCRRGHAVCELGCGRVLTVRLDGSPRVHTRCPNRAVMRYTPAMTSTTHLTAPTAAHDAPGTVRLHAHTGSMRTRLDVALDAAAARLLAEQLLAAAREAEQLVADNADQAAYADAMGLGA